MRAMEGRGRTRERRPMPIITRSGRGRKSFGSAKAAGDRSEDDATFQSVATCGSRKTWGEERFGEREAAC